MSIVNRPDLIIVIDPDVKMSGVACVDVAEGTVVAEASWSTAHNWHGKANEGKKVSGRKGYDVGRNHQTGMDIIDILRHRGITVVEKRPLAKIWKGRDGKITHEGSTLSACNWKHNIKIL